ncbi:hypothetical protein [Rhodanobacter denitrificans]|uniref:hypothetical protein n=1 Tax=Rhodanobacter denitrificans TaxID=666685 RepID=UPI000916A16C|nr:hypothetical protein [Rhodanobacter denitrificans]UJJ52975.1 hypothetical protein LRK52_18915 [Rhodanobacter denitrificans]
MATLKNLQPGQVLYTEVRRRRGHTALRETATFRVTVVSVDVEARRVLASWNGNPPKSFRETDVKRWLVKPRWREDTP